MAEKTENLITFEQATKAVQDTLKIVDSRIQTLSDKVANWHDELRDELLSKLAINAEYCASEIKALKDQIDQLQKG